MLTPSTGLVVIDLDSYKANGDSNVLGFHRQISECFKDTYQELSPSGKGVHVWCKGTWSGRNRSGPCMEVYAANRYITLTGISLNHNEVLECQQQLNQLALNIDAGKPSDVPTIESQPETLTDEQIYKSCIQGATGDKFKELWEGRWQLSYPSQSEADLALCNLIAFWTDNKTQCGRIFRKSELGKRDKAKRSDYLFRKGYGIVTKAFDQKLQRNDLSASDPTKKQQLPVTQYTGVEIMTCSNIAPENVTWLWDRFLPLGHFALVVGKAEAGKSTLTLKMAATVSTGGKWPDGTDSEQGYVLIWTSEDNPRNTIIPRLTAMGANCDNIGIIQSTVDALGRKRRFDPANDIPRLQAQLGANPGVKLVIIDPVVSVVEGDMNTANNVRGGLDVLPALAEEWKCCVVGLTHFKKGSEGRDLMDRIIGSQAFHALPRVALAVGKDSQSSKRVLCFAKNNLAPRDGGFEFTIVGTQFEHEGQTIKATELIFNNNLLEGTGEQIIESVEHFEEQRHKAAYPQSKLDAAKELAIKLLENGKTMPVVEFDAKATAEGISTRTWTMVKKELNIVSAPTRMGGPFMVKLPFNSLFINPFQGNDTSSNS